MALPAYSIPTAVDAEHALIVAHSITLDADMVVIRRTGHFFVRVFLILHFQRTGKPLAAISSAS
jgi:hypothetical protein